MNQYFVYFLSNYTKTVLYVGVTNDLQRRLQEHRSHLTPNSFTSKYNCYYLMWFESHNDIKNAIAREKQLKNWKRAWKDALIQAKNPNWDDLSIGWD